ncbi:MAG: sigma-70 family RNA polymerase sigma factor [Nitrospinae bacterium]|nr:sigma-70 family RNA polymerase sigma factor [Nitrospinota bacterium]
MLFSKKRTEDGFKQIALPHLKFIYNMALRLSGSEYDAEDLTQETFYIAFKKFYQLKDENKCKNWLFSIMRNLYLKEVERKGNFRELNLDNEGEYLQNLESIAAKNYSENEMIKKIDNQGIQPLLDRIPEKYKSPFLLFYMDNRSYKEIADTLNIPIGTVMSRISRGRDFVKNIMLKNLVVSEANLMANETKVIRANFKNPVRRKGEGGETEKKILFLFSLSLFLLNLFVL